VELESNIEMKWVRFLAADLYHMWGWAYEVDGVKVTTLSLNTSPVFLMNNWIEN